MTLRTDENTPRALVGDRGNPADGMLLRLCAGLAVCGTIMLIGSNVLGSVLLDSHDWVADTVSDLAAGDLEIIQDVGLYGYAGALIALALANAHVRMPGRSWTVTVFTLALLALCVTVIGARNEYGDGDDEGVEVHIYVVYALGVLFTLLFFAATRGLRHVAASYRWISLGCGVAWAIGAPVFFVLPTNIDGLWERGLGIVTCVWVITMAHALWTLSGEALRADVQS